MLLRLKKDLSRAKMAVNELGKVVCAVRSSTTKHYARLKKFQKRIARLGTSRRDVVWHELCREVEGILDPTLQLVSEIANAQERIRYQSNYLMTFSEMRTDSLTGLGNRRALDHVLSTQFSMLKRYGTPFSLAIIDIDHFKNLNDEHGHLHGDQMLRDLTGLLTDTSRTVDILARYGGDEFVVVMPQTDLAGAAMVGERLRARSNRRCRSPSASASRRPTTPTRRNLCSSGPMPHCTAPRPTAATALAAIRRVVPPMHRPRTCLCFQRR